MKASWPAVNTFLCVCSYLLFACLYTINLCMSMCALYFLSLSCKAPWVSESTRPFFHCQFPRCIHCHTWKIIKFKCLYFGFGMLWKERGGGEGAHDAIHTWGATVKMADGEQVVWFGSRGCCADVGVTRGYLWWNLCESYAKSCAVQLRWVEYLYMRAQAEILCKFYIFTWKQRLCKIWTGRKSASARCFDGIHRQDSRSTW